MSKKNEKKPKFTKINIASATLFNKNKKTNEKLSYEGFEIDKELIGLSAKKKDKSNATIMAMTFTNSPLINNNNFVMLFYQLKIN